MNQKLLNAVQSLENALDPSEGESMDELMHKLLPSHDFGEAEIAAAVWMLISQGLAEIRDGKVYLTEAPVPA